MTEEMQNEVSGIILQSDLKPVSFEKTRELTKGQRAIVNILIKKAGSGEMLRREDIAELYTTIEQRIYYKFQGYDVVDHHPLDSRYGKEKQRVEKYESIILTKDNIRNYWRCMNRAMQWFKNNLATCIIKGKILAIPVIEDI